MITLICFYNYDVGVEVKNKIDTLRVREQAGEIAAHLSTEFRVHYETVYKNQSMYGGIYFILMGLLTPPMLMECLQGKLAWKDLAAYMLVLAFLGTISGMIVMSLNYPFMMHAATYTVSGITVVLTQLHQYRVVKKVREWEHRQASSRASMIK